MVSVPKEVSILLKGFKGQHNIMSGHRGIMYDSEKIMVSEWLQISDVAYPLDRYQKQLNKGNNKITIFQRESQNS
jgi:hypothetical protein